MNKTLIKKMNLMSAWRRNRKRHVDQLLPLRVLYRDRHEKSLLTVDFIFFVATSATIASLGILADSSAAVIGAMIIAPLMDPILSFSFGSVVGQWRMVRRALLAVGVGSLVVIATSVLVGLIFGSVSINSEIQARTSPNLIDFGIALGAGAAGSFAFTRARVSAAVAGVAIAVALVPPLCVAGIGLVISPELFVRFGVGSPLVPATNVSLDAALLFATNFTTIALVAMAVFVSQGYGSLRHAWRYFLVLVGLTVLLFQPLAHGYRAWIVKGNIRMALQQLGVIRIDLADMNTGEEEDGYWSAVEYQTLNVALEDQHVQILVVGNASLDALGKNDLIRIKDHLFDSLSKDERVDIRSVELRLRMLDAREYRFRQSL